ELALRRTAEKTESQLEQMMRGQDDEVERAWATTATERVMVAFDARPHASELLRTGWRLARGLKAPLIAVTVASPPVRLAHKNPADGRERALQEHARLAEDLGAEVVRIEGRDVAAELARVARERRVTQIVIGQPARGRWAELLGGGSVVNRLLRLPTGADIHVVPHPDGCPPP